MKVNNFRSLGFRCRLFFALFISSFSLSSSKFSENCVCRVKDIGKYLRFAFFSFSVVLSSQINYFKTFAWKNLFLVLMEIFFFFYPNKIVIREEEEEEGEGEETKNKTSFSKSFYEGTSFEAFNMSVKFSLFTTFLSWPAFSHLSPPPHVYPSLNQRSFINHFLLKNFNNFRIVFIWYLLPDYIYWFERCYCWLVILLFFFFYFHKFSQLLNLIFWFVDLIYHYFVSRYHETYFYFCCSYYLK